MPACRQCGWTELLHLGRTHKSPTLKSRTWPNWWRFLKASG